MLRIEGIVSPGKNNALGNLRHVQDQIAKRSGLLKLVPGTLNVELDRHYPMTAVTGIVTEVEYDHWQECIKLQRCRIGPIERTEPRAAVRGVIVRPSGHEDPARPHWMRVEVMSHHHLRSVLGVTDGARVWIEVESEKLLDDQWWKREERLAG